MMKSLKVTQIEGNKDVINGGLVKIFICFLLYARSHCIFLGNVGSK